MKKFSYLFTLVLTFCACFTAGATVRKVYFIGNSYTYTNSMPTMLHDLAAANGDTLIYSMSAPGGYTFQQHTTNATTIAGIFSQQWDIVVLQEQSQMPAFPPAQVATDVYPYAARLDSFINANDTCTETMFMMTWGRRNGDVMNCAGYPAVCTYAGMQGRLRESYMQMAQDNHASVAPMGAAWKIVIDSFPSIDLYISDSSHPSLAGSYLQACVFYASIFNRKATGNTYTAGLPATTVSTLQRIADKVVIDSIAQWQQYGHYPYAAYTRTHTAATAVSFTNKSQRATGYTWAFGDGNTDTAANPVHAYASSGVYTVTLTTTTDCFTISIKDTVHIGAVTGIAEVGSSAADVLIGRAQDGSTSFISPAGVCRFLDVYDLNGRRVWSTDLANGQQQKDFVPGMYFYRAYPADKSSVATGRFVAW